MPLHMLFLLPGRLCFLTSAPYSLSSSQQVNYPHSVEARNLDVILGFPSPSLTSIHKSGSMCYLIGLQAISSLYPHSNVHSGMIGLFPDGMVALAFSLTSQPPAPLPNVFSTLPLRKAVLEPCTLPRVHCFTSWIAPVTSEHGILGPSCSAFFSRCVFSALSHKLFSASMLPLGGPPWLP